MTLLLESAMDAIVVLNGRFEIVRVNPAAERLLGCTPEDLLGESLKDFLAPESLGRVEAFAKEIQSRPQGQQQLWVPQDFVARRWDHSVFPAEATLSRFENQREVFYTLILRNADERLEAERQIRLLTQEADYLREAVRELPDHGSSTMAATTSALPGDLTRAPQRSRGSGASSSRPLQRETRVRGRPPDRATSSR